MHLRIPPPFKNENFISFVVIEEIETRFSDAAFVIRVKTFNAIMSSVHSVCLKQQVCMCVCLSVYVCVNV